MLGAFSSLANSEAKHADKSAETTDTAVDQPVATPLAHTQDRLVSTNLVWPSGADQKAQSEALLRERLESARKQRERKDFVGAHASLVGIMENEAPEDLWRDSMLELALLAQDEGDLAKAQQVYSQYLSRWPQDSNVPEILLRQGLIYRDMGLNQVAISKFYAVMTSALAVKADKMEHYQRLVIQAQSEIAETYYSSGKIAPARDSLTRLLKQESTNLNRPVLELKLVRCLAELKVWDELVRRGQDLLRRFPEVPESGEVRFMIATGFRELGNKEESFRQMQLLLQQAPTPQNVASLAYWKGKAGNDIGNQLYKDGDFLRALDIYVTLADLDKRPDWQCPVLYQVGLIYEHLDQPAKAAETYQKILGRETEIGATAPPSLKTVMDLAKWRARFLGWKVQTEATQRALNDISDDSTLPDSKPKPSS